MSDEELAISVGKEIDALGDDFFADRQFTKTENYIEAGKVIVYSLTTDGVIIPYFRTMLGLNEVSV